MIGSRPHVDEMYALQRTGLDVRVRVGAAVWRDKLARHRKPAVLGRVVARPGADRVGTLSLRHHHAAIVHRNRPGGGIEKSRLPLLTDVAPQYHRQPAHGTAPGPRW